MTQITRWYNEETKISKPLEDWDSTSLGALKSCPRLYYYSIIKGYGIPPKPLEDCSREELLDCIKSLSKEILRLYQPSEAEQASPGVSEGNRGVLHENEKTVVKEP